GSRAPDSRGRHSASGSARARRLASPNAAADADSGANGEVAGKAAPATAAASGAAALDQAYQPSTPAATAAAAQASLLLRIQRHVGAHLRDHAAPVAVGVVVVRLAVIAEHHRVVGPLRVAAFGGAGAQRQVVAEPVGRVAVRAARAAGDAAA